ncbi:MAG: diacylglycerol kinase family lipid kinase [Bacteroidales bacterium]|nr:diacylglycerol kinase family lipid kinase [Bacteroidales bacterium]MCF8454741.1 diacylglycerol kinase family lipid kinase [Bacteroidales bacterium]
MQRILFIINPVSGTKRKEKLLGVIHDVFKGSKLEYHIEYTEYAGHAKEIANNAVENGFDCIVAVGGDGSVNEVGSALVGKNCTLGIIPCGSGNGLARSLKISMNARKALFQIVKEKTMDIDTLQLNELFFINVAGLGFDAQVAHLFKKQDKRGLLSYMKAMLISYSRFKPIEISYKIEDETFQEKVFLMSFANSEQYGNNAYIAPLASLNDGLIDISILKPFPLFAAPGIVLSLVSKRIHKSKYFVGHLVSEIEIETSGSTEIHIDGEAVNVDNFMKVGVQTEKLRMICGF